MRIQFDRASAHVSYPVDSTTVKRVLRRCVPKETLERISKVRFGCNLSTTQEARIVGRGDTYEIRVNFSLVDGKSKLLSAEPAWVRIVEDCGGVISRKASEVEWSPGAARRYAVFLLLHEVGHAIYAEERGIEFLKDASFSNAEERWCDRYAQQALERVAALL